jgi:hypothetical protein
VPRVVLPALRDPAQRFLERLRPREVIALRMVAAVLAQQLELALGLLAAVAFVLPPGTLRGRPLRRSLRSSDGWEKR